MTLVGVAWKVSRFVIAYVTQVLQHLAMSKSEKLLHACTAHKPVWLGAMSINFWL